MNRTTNLLGIAIFCVIVLLSADLRADPLDNWSSLNPTFRGIAYGGDTFVIVGDSGKIITSKNGSIWTYRMSGLQCDLNGIAYGDGAFVAVGPLRGTPASSFFVSNDEGESWTPITAPTGVWLGGITYGNGTFVVVGYDGISSNGAIFTSPDGVAWTNRPLEPTTSLAKVTYGNGLFVAVGDFGTILTSPDGITWKREQSGVITAIFDVTFGKGIFVAVGGIWNIGFAPPMPNELILISQDGTTWTPINRGDDDIRPLNAVTYGSNRFVAVGNTGKILTSSDGVTWTKKEIGESATLNDVAFGNDRFIAVGDNDTILQSQFLSGYCTASLSSDMSLLYIPIFTFKGQSFWAELSNIPGTRDFVVSSMSVVSDMNSFADCTPSTLTNDLKVHIPSLIFNHVSYRADGIYDQGIVRATSVGRN